MGPASSDHHRRIAGDDISPLERDPGELPRVVVEVDAVLAPRLTAVNPLEDTPMEGMEGMRNSKCLSLITRRRCNRQLTPKGGSSGITARIRTAW